MGLILDPRVLVAVERDGGRFARARLQEDAKYAIASYLAHLDSPRTRATAATLGKDASRRGTGARQTGKTSTFLRLFPKRRFVSLDLPTEAEQAEKEPRSFINRCPPPVIIDGVEYAPGLFRHLKVVVDADRGRNGQFLLTGSQKFTLMKSISESLAGRADIVELETLVLAEIRAELPEVALETAFVSKLLGNSMPASGAVVCRAPYPYPLPGGFRALPVTDI